MAETVQLMLVVACKAELAGLLTDVLERHAIASVLIVPDGWSAASASFENDNDGTWTNLDEPACRALVAAAQAHDCAALIANDAALAQAVGADGCHLDAARGIDS
ncbi:MAG: hypothetical protein KKB37_15910, partial [Alphaproteobacteria bacterium]|nr:hypothetical protein [Alphaproteobacteria bacterium]